jgi:excisionase family DNA binding protein
MSISGDSNNNVSLPARPSIQRAADFLGVTDRTIRRRIADGTLKAYRVGPRLIRVDRESLLALAKPMGGAA